MSITNVSNTLFQTNLDYAANMKLWDEFMKTQPKCLLSPEELTEVIRTEAPEYHFEYDEEKLKKGEELRDTLRAAVRDQAYHVCMSEYSDLAAGLFGKREGTSFGSYIEFFMPERLEEMREAAELQKKKDPGAEEKLKKLHQAVMKDYMNNREVRNLREGLGSMPLSEIAKNWNKISAVIYLSDVQNTLKPYKKWYDSEEMAQYIKAMTSALDAGFMVEGKLSLKASNIGPMVDEEQLLKLDSNQLYNLSKKEDVFDSARNNPFEDARMNAAILPNNVCRRINEKFGEGNIVAPLMQNVLGEMVDDLSLERSVIRRRLPMYAISRMHPDMDPVLVFVDDKGRIHTGDDAKIIFAEAPMPKKPEPPKAKTGIAGWFSRVFNTSSNQKFKADQAKYEAELAAYNKLGDLKTHLDKLDAPLELDRIKDELFRGKYGKSAKEYAKEKKLNVPGVPDPEAEFERKLRSTGLPENVRGELKILHDCIRAEKESLKERSSRLTDPDAELDSAFLRNTGAAAIICHKAEKTLNDEIDRLVKTQPVHPQLSPKLTGFLPDGLSDDPKSVIEDKLFGQVLKLTEGELLQDYSPSREEVGDLVDGSSAQKEKAVQDILQKAEQEKTRKDRTRDTGISVGGKNPEKEPLVRK